MYPHADDPLTQGYAGVLCYFIYQSSLSQSPTVSMHDHSHHEDKEELLNPEASRFLGKAIIYFSRSVDLEPHDLFVHYLVEVPSFFTW
jgi:hypothetical protein